MCFSATASFSASAILALVGIASVKKVGTKSQLVFALIPIVFSIQQLTEGFVWITLVNSNYERWQFIPIYIFVFFAQVVWTSWVPLSFFLIKKNLKRKKMLFVLVIIGLLISIYIFCCLLLFNVKAVTTPFHIHYKVNFPIPHFIIFSSFYFLTIVAPPLISSIKKASIIGFLLFTSFLVTKIYFSDNVISVWCFFAALTSLMVFIIMKDLNKGKIQLREIALGLLKFKRS